MNTLIYLLAILGLDWLLTKIVANPRANLIIDIIALILIFVLVITVRLQVNVK